MKTLILFATVTGALVLGGCNRSAASSGATPPNAEVLHAAVHQLTSVIVYDIFSPPQASRVYAYSSIAAYETLRQGNRAYRTLAGQLNGLTPVPLPDSGVEYSLPLAGVHAFMTVGRALTFSRARMDSLRSATDEQFRRTGMSAQVFARSIAYGEKVAQHILDWSAQDRFKESRGYAKYSVSPTPGRWIPTPPAYMDAVEPNWGSLRPFVLDSSSQFRPEPALTFDTAKASPFFRQVQDVYDVGRNLTSEQRAIAAFWDCNPYVMHVQGHTMFATKKVTPGGHWMGIVAIASRKAGADLLMASETYARASIALADGFISAWDEKYHSNVARPETMIDMYVDEGWEPLLQTPPFPEYPSAHSVISTAVAKVLTEQFGANFAFADSTELEYGLPVRTFGSFEQASAEAAISRLYGGIHYRRAVEQGAAMGAKVGALLLQRIHTRGDRAVAESLHRGGT